MKKIWLKVVGGVRKPSEVAKPLFLKRNAVADAIFI